MIQNICYVYTIEGEDYSEYSQTLEIGPSLENETLTVFIPILNDVLAEPMESFTVELLSIGSGAHIDSGRGEARVDIIDNDGTYNHVNRIILANNQ